MSDHLFLIALGSNVYDRRFGRPEDVLKKALVAIGGHDISIVSVSRTVRSRPIGPSQREYANAAALAFASFAPRALLGVLQAVEAAFERERRGQRWRARVLDLDIVLWEGGIFAERNLQIPHPEFRRRAFVLGPASEIAPHWIDPISNLSLAQLNARLTRARGLPR